MNDEATVHYSDVIDQMTLGHDFLFREFGVRPSIAWHIDPFGHSNSHPGLFARMGFDAIFFARIDYQDYEGRVQNRELEMVWRGVKSYSDTADLFTSVMYGTEIEKFRSFSLLKRQRKRTEFSNLPQPLQRIILLQKDFASSVITFNPSCLILHSKITISRNVRKSLRP